MTAFPALLTVAEVEALRVGKPILKGPTRLDERIADTRDEQADERRWRKGVIAHDGYVCRCCGRRVIQQLTLAANQLHVHHVAPRADQAVRWDVRNGMVLCAECHAYATPHQGTKTQIVLLQAAALLFTVGGKTYINARAHVEFQQRIAGEPFAPSLFEGLP